MPAAVILSKTELRGDEQRHGMAMYIVMCSTAEELRHSRAFVEHFELRVNTTCFVVTLWLHVGYGTSAKLLLAQMFCFENPARMRVGFSATAESPELRGLISSCRSFDRHPSSMSSLTNLLGPLISVWKVRLVFFTSGSVSLRVRCRRGCCARSGIDPSYLYYFGVGPGVCRNL